ncbi:hypothetical protein H2198_008402 [Neophaeococcomyces mojaviensis]|uniref:Uncharacterized protein n=1 Tax=Neophaeococcomyces mojaviensis TaxID=3383035 RepID=A0ACC2ZXD2_9EURO|nr:hypothetical protein H2198_008402 [Knufia sp. JES_112]
MFTNDLGNKRFRDSKSSLVSDDDEEPKATFRRTAATFLRLNWSRYGDDWYPEVAAVSFSFTCTMAMVIVLQQFDQKPAPLVPFGLTINTVVAILATASKVALIFVVSNAIGQMKWVWFNSDQQNLLDVEIFDDASRGPLGSLRMLSEKTRWSLGSVGALLTLLALLFDPFVQQIVVLESHVDHTPSDTVRTEQATFFSAVPDDFLSIQALNAALWGTDFNETVICPSGNCYWEPFESVGWCKQCQDSTLDLNQPCSFAESFSRNDSTELGNWNETLTYGYISENCTLKLGDKVTSRQEKMLQGTTFFNVTAGWGLAQIRMPKYKILKLESIMEEAQLTLTPLSSQKYFDVGFRPMIRFGVSTFQYNENFTMRINKTTDCSLYLCVQNRNLSVSDGIVKSNVIGTTPGNWSWQALPGRVDSNRSSASNEWHLCWTPFNEPLVKISIGRAHNGFVTNMGRFGFCISQSSLPGYWDWPKHLPIFGDALTTLKINFTIVADQPGIQSLSDTRITQKWTEDIAPDTVIQNFLFMGAEQTTQNIAASLTKLALQANTTSVLGSLGSPVSYLNVRGTWLILPVMLPISTLLFLIAVMSSSYRSSAPLWKSSVNALIYHGLDHDMDIKSSLHKISQMDAQAASTQAKLAPFGRDDRLVLETSTARSVM